MSPPRCWPRSRATIAFGPHAPEVLAEVARALALPPPRAAALARGEALAWFPARSSPSRPASSLKRPAPSGDATCASTPRGSSAPNRSFYFRGRDERLNLRASNLAQFLELGDGVDDETWLFHLQAGDYTRWFRDAIEDSALAEEAATITATAALDPTASRARDPRGDRGPLHRARVTQGRLSRGFTAPYCQSNYGGRQPWRWT